MLPGQGRAFRMRSSKFHEKAAKCKALARNTSRADHALGETFEVSRLALGHATLRVDPETIADIKVVLKPLFDTTKSSAAGPVSTSASTANDDSAGRSAEPNGGSTEDRAMSQFSVSFDGIDTWMALDAPDGPCDRKADAGADSELHGHPPGDRYELEKPSWLLLELGHGVWQSAATDEDEDQDGTLDVSCTALRLCTGSLTASVGETGFQRALEMQLAAQHLESSRTDMNLRFWQLARTGLYRSRRDDNHGISSINIADSSGSGTDYFTLAMTDDGAPVESDFARIIDIQELSVTRDNRGQVSMHPSGSCMINLDAARVPFLAACWQAVLGNPWAEGTAPPGDTNTTDPAGLIQHYWVRIMREAAGDKIAEAGSTACSGPAAKRMAGTSTQNNESRDEISRLREELAVARAQAKHWKNVAETL